MSTLSGSTMASVARPAKRRAAARVVAALLARLVLFAAAQALVAALLLARGHPAPWSASAAWWPVTVIAANVASFALLRTLLHAEGERFRDLLFVDRARIGRDLILTLGILAVGGALATAPNVGLAALLWGDPGAPLELFLRPLPAWAAWLALAGFPVTIAISELPTYYAYARPRIERLGLSPAVAVGGVALMHALQHAALPLLFDARFLVWRALMFLPFALFVGWVLRWRPRLLPYLMIAHGLLDASVAATIVRAAHA